MNRSERRKHKQLISKEAKILKDELVRAQTKTLNDGRAEAMLLLFILTLHEEFGFGRDRCMRALKRIDDEMGLWIEGTEDLESLKKKVMEKVGIEVKT